MYRRPFAWLACVVLLIPFAVGAQQKPAQSQPYVMLPTPLETEGETKTEVREFFWYGCNHCYALEPAIERWLKRKPAHVTFVRTPAAVGGWTVHAQAYYAFEALGIVDRVHSAFFDAIHKHNRKLNDEASIAKFVSEHGADAAKFREAFNSFGVRMKLEKAKRLYQATGADGVPSLVVAGQYATSPAMAGGADSMFTIVDLLLTNVAPTAMMPPRGPISPMGAANAQGPMNPMGPTRPGIPNPMSAPKPRGPTPAKPLLPLSPLRQPQGAR
jgi:protein dithiol oxidoreductase (disulfide-forming)